MLDARAHEKAQMQPDVGFARTDDHAQSEASAAPLMLHLARAKGGVADTAMQAWPIAWEDFLQTLAEPEVGPKDGAYFVRGRCSGKRGDAAMASATDLLLVVDGDTQVDPETGAEPMKVLHPGESKPDYALPCVNPSAVHAALRRHGIRHVIYTSHSYQRRGEGWHKWRLIVPSNTTPATLVRATDALLTILWEAGLCVWPVSENYKLSQPWYLPRVAPERIGKYMCLFGDGGVFDVDKLAPPAAPLPPREAPSPRPGLDVIGAFNAANDVTAMLAQRGYRRIGRRFLPPTSASGIPGVVLLDDGRVYCHNGSDKLGDGKAHDAFDLLSILDHGGDDRAALKAAYRALGWSEHAAKRSTGGGHGAHPDKDPDADFAPEPLRRPVPPAASYPMAELGPVLEPAAQALRRVIQAPDAVCASSILAAASLASQGLADVHLDGRVYPTSLWILSVAESGERKSATDSEAMRAAAEYEQELGRQYAIDAEIHAALMAEWDVRREQAKNEARKTRGEGLAKMLMEIGSAPSVPMQPKITVADFTAEGITKLLMVGRPSIGAFTDEAALVFGGHGMTKETVARTAATLCKLWDKGSVDRIRAGEGATKLYGRRLALHLMAQPVIAERAIADDVLSGQGFLARCLLCWPEGTAGHRPYVAESLRDDHALAHLRQRLLQLHREPLPVAGDDPRELSPRALRLDTAAADLWQTLHNAVEAGMRQGGIYCQVKPWASKTPEQALRIAGVLTLIEDPYAQTITKEVMDRAAELALWHLGEAVRLVGASETSAEIRDAEALLDWCHQTSRAYLYSRVALNRGPGRIRDRDRFIKAIEVLEKAGWARREPTGTEVDGAPRRQVWRIAPREA